MAKRLFNCILYDHYASVTRPVRELKGFQLVELNAGESKKVTFTITSELLKFYSANQKWEAEPGRF